MPSILEAFERHILNGNLDNILRKKIQHVEWRYQAEKTSAEDTRRKGVWQRPRGLQAVHVFPVHFVIMLYQ